MFKERGSIVVFVVLSSTSFALKGLICSILTPSLGIRLRYSNLNKCITKLNDDDGILLERNAYWNPMEEYSNDIIYLDLCTHPFMSMFQMSGSGDDPLTWTPTGSRNPQGSSSTRPLGLPLTPQQHLQLSSPGISVRAYGTPSPLRISCPTSTMTVRPPGGVTQQRLIPLPTRTQIRILRSATSQTPMRSPILTTSITPSTVSTAMPRNLTPRTRIITSSNNMNIALSSAVGTLSTIRVGGGGNIRMAAAGASNRDTSFTAPPPPTGMGESSENETEGSTEPPLSKKGRIAPSAVHE